MRTTSSWRGLTRCAGVLAALLLLACASLPREREYASWIEIRSRGLRIVSEIDVETTRAMARELEPLEAVAAHLTGAALVPPRVPTTIVIFRNAASYRRFAASDTNGVFIAGQRENFALIDGTARAGGLGVLMHEYSHYAVRNAAAMAYPAWYDEGVAELMRGTRAGDAVIQIGLPLEDRKLTPLQSRILPLCKLLTADPGALDKLESAAFYAKSWHLVRYLRFGGELGLHDRSAELDDYLVRVHGGQAAEAAWREAFGVDANEFEAELDDYLRRLPSAGVDLARSDSTSGRELEAHALDALEAERILGTVALRTQRYARAERHFRAVLASAPRDARTHFGLALALRAQKRERECGELYARGLALEPDAALSQLDYAQYLLAQVDARTGSTDPDRTPLLGRAREHLRRAIELDPELPEAHAQLASSYLLDADGDVEQGLAEALRAQQLLSSDSRVSYLLAVAHYRSGRLEPARKLLAIAKAQTHRRTPELETLEARIAQASTDAPAAGTGY